MPGTPKCSINVGSLPLLFPPAKPENEVGWHPDEEEEVPALTQEPPGSEQAAWTASGSALGTANRELMGISLSLSKHPTSSRRAVSPQAPKKCSTTRALVQIPSFFLYFCASLSLPGSLSNKPHLQPLL